MSIEYCFRCNNETGNAGADEDSLMIDSQPYCDGCYREEIHDLVERVDKLQKENKELRGELLHVMKKLGDSSIGFDEQIEMHDRLHKKLREGIQ